MLIHTVKVSGLLSFGTDGLAVPLRNLNVLIGPNGSGKSNLLEVLSLLRSAPRDLSAPVKARGGVREWLWKGPNPASEARIEVTFGHLRHVLVFGAHGDRFEVVDEQIDHTLARPIYWFQRGNPVFFEGHGTRPLNRENVLPEQSILSQVRDPERYSDLAWLQYHYERMRLYRNWSFGPDAGLRHAQSTHDRSDVLSEGAENLALVLSKIRGRIRPELRESLQKLYDGVEDFNTQIDGGNVLLYLQESGGREIPATRLSDGTLRYLALLALLLHPEPPSVIAIEEPELGLHPDLIPHVARLLVRASERTQLFVTTHSRMLVEALGDDPSRILVCEKVAGESRIRRLDSDRLAAWLKDYSLGELWSMGEIGGNRW
jgi:predicted ATPase